MFDYPQFPKSYCPYITARSRQGDIFHGVFYFERKHKIFQVLSWQVFSRYITKEPDCAQPLRVAKSSVCQSIARCRATHYRRCCRHYKRALVLTNDATKFKKWTSLYSLAYFTYSRGQDTRLCLATSDWLCFNVGRMRERVLVLPPRLTSVSVSKYNFGRGIETRGNIPQTASNTYVATDVFCWY